MRCMQLGQDESALQDYTVTSPALFADAEGKSPNNTTENRDFTYPPVGYSNVKKSLQCRLNKVLLR